MTVELLGHYGGDKTHALSAWTSTSRDLYTLDKHGRTKEERIPELLKMLAKDGHHTPFEKSMLHFLVSTDIASHIHILKHRVGVSANAESARYRELLDDRSHVPDDWPEDEKARLAAYIALGQEEYHSAVKRLKPILGAKRAKESARYYLPYATVISTDLSFNFRSFVHFLGLRNSEHAQREIRLIAQAMLDAVRFETGGAFRHSLEAFGL